MRSWPTAIFLLVSIATAPVWPAVARARPWIEVLHYWTSGGESKAMGVLKRDFEAAGGEWTDSPVAGGGGDAAAATLRLRLLAGNPPGAALLKGRNIADWAREGVLEPVVFPPGRGLPPLPDALRRGIEWKGRTVAVPIDVHRVNWLWANARLLARVGAGMPATWEEFDLTAVKLKAAGIIPLAHGSDPWQDATMFETVALSIGGPAYFRAALVDGDEQALKSDVTRRIFERMRRLSDLLPKDQSRRDWNAATAMMMRGEAAFQFMGDWVKGELAAAGEEPGRDILCAPPPGKQGFILNSDSFVMFHPRDGEEKRGQALLARLLFGRRFQETFNLYKGSIPARLDTPMDRFDVCALRSRADLDADEANGSLVPSVTHEMAGDAARRGAILDTVTEHFTTRMSADEAVRRLVDAMRLAR